MRFEGESGICLLTSGGTTTNPVFEGMSNTSLQKSISAISLEWLTQELSASNLFATVVFYFIFKGNVDFSNFSALEKHHI